MTNHALEIEFLSLSIGGNPILNNISLEVGRGEMWSIIGPNGAGKSSLLKCLMRIHTRWEGHVRLFNRRLMDYSQRELARRIAYVPQSGGDQNLSYTVYEFVRMGRYPYSGPFGSAHPGDHEAIQSAMEQAGVMPFADRLMDTLSGGERQKVLIAAVLAQEADILLLDEPTSFLDYRYQSDVLRILRHINQERGVTILSVTHDINSAILMGGPVLALRNGEAVWCGMAKELPAEGRLNAIFHAHFRFLDDPVTQLRFVVPQGADQ